MMIKIKRRRKRERERKETDRLASEKWMMNPCRLILNSCWQISHSTTPRVDARCHEEWPDWSSLSQTVSSYNKPREASIVTGILQQVVYCCFCCCCCCCRCSAKGRRKRRRRSRRNGMAIGKWRRRGRERERERERESLELFAPSFRIEKSQKPDEG